MHSFGAIFGEVSPPRPPPHTDLAKSRSSPRHWEFWDVSAIAKTTVRKPWAALTRSSLRDTLGFGVRLTKNDASRNILAQA